MSCHSGDFPGKGVRKLQIATGAAKARTLESANAFSSDNPSVVVFMYPSYISGHNAVSFFNFRYTSICLAIINYKYVLQTSRIVFCVALYHILGLVQCCFGSLCQLPL